MDSTQLQLLTELHLPRQRQGPGGDAETLRALDLANPPADSPLRILDIGCGTGAASLLLAQQRPALITAVDFLPAFLEQLQHRALAAGLADSIGTLQASMDALPLEDSSFDLIWSEGAVYNMGFEAGVRAWRPLLADDGLLVVSEITWLTATRPQPLEDYWQAAYPEIDTAAGKLRVLENSGYSPQAYFILPPHCWIENYYQPLEQNFDDFLQQQGQSADARALVAAEREEIALYRRYGQYYSYGVYIAKRVD